MKHNDEELYDALPMDSDGNLKIKKKLESLTNKISKLARKEMRDYDQVELMFLKEFYGEDFIYSLGTDVKKILEEPRYGDTIH